MTATRCLGDEPINGMRYRVTQVAGPGVFGPSPARVRLEQYCPERWS